MKAIYTVIVEKADAEHSLEPETVLMLDRVAIDWCFNNKDHFENELKQLYDKWQAKLFEARVSERNKK